MQNNTRNSDTKKSNKRAMLMKTFKRYKNIRNHVNPSMISTIATEGKQTYNVTKNQNGPTCSLFQFATLFHPPIQLLQELLFQCFPELIEKLRPEQFSICHRREKESRN